MQGWIELVELRGEAEKGKGGNKYKKRPRKNRGRTVELIVAGRGGCHPYRLDKTVVVLSPIAGPGISLIASSGSRDGCTANSGLLFRPRARSGPPDSAPAFVSVSGDCPSVLGFPPGSDLLIRSALRLWFRSQAAALVSAPGSNLLIRSAPGPGIIRRAAPVRARRHQRHRLPESRPAAWRRAPRTRSRAPAASRRPS